MLQREIRIAAVIAALAGSEAATGQLFAEEVRVLAAGAVQRAVNDIVAEFRVTNPGHTLVIAFDTVGALRDRALGGEIADVVLLSEAGLKALGDRGRLVDGRIVRLGATEVGICVQVGTPALDLTSPDKLKATLLAATSIVHADPARGATAGSHFRKLLGVLGLENELAGRISVVPFGGDIAKDVAAGKFALGVSQLTEIRTVSGVRGYPLPEPHSLKTVYGYGLGRPPGEGASAFLSILTGERGRAAFERSGFMP